VDRRETASGFSGAKGDDYADLQDTKTEFVTAAKNALEADLTEWNCMGPMVICSNSSFAISNIRKDNYGGTIENRSRFVLEVVASVSEAIGKGKTGIRLSPYGVASDMPHYPEINATYNYLSEQLNKIGIAYIHLVDHSAMGAPEVPMEIKKLIRKKFQQQDYPLGGMTGKERKPIFKAD